ncbi:hypothetical protein MP638_004583 [Amoeboaphelidium occidentale]|nr:hypothetical protein MP638_004583 [Amoeboaphelidium occidentale]
MTSAPNQSKDGKISLVWSESKDGEFRRQVSSFRDHVSNAADAKFKPEADRYHLYISHACPWAHRTAILRKIKGLEDAIGLSVVHYLLGPDGWKFDNEGKTDGCIADTVNNATFLREIYFAANPNYSGRFTVPVLWDKKLKTIVNNESSEIIRMLNSEFNNLAKYPEIDMAPKDLLPKIDEINEWVYNGLNNRVYQAGFATKQEVYEKHCRAVFETLDRIEAILEKNAFLTGDRFTEADVRCFTTVVRFDPVYTGHFKCNLKSIRTDYPNILRWMKSIYHMEHIAETVNMDHIKKHYYMSHIAINPNQIVGLSEGPKL